MKQRVLKAILITLFGALAFAQPERPTLTNNDMLKMVQTGLNPDLIVKVIADFPKDFRFMPEGFDGIRVSECTGARGALMAALC